MIEGEEELMLRSAIQKQSISKAKKKKKGQNFHLLKKKVKRNLSKFKFSGHFGDVK